MNAPLRHVSLNDKYALSSGRVFLTGTHALVRLLLLQHQRDVIAGLNTGGLVSGYRGSPLGSVDQALFSAKSHLSKSGVAFQPRINENLAATAVWGTQQVYLRPGAKVDGVYAMWYGKGPGVDRSGDGETADGGDTTERNHAGRPAGDDSWFWSRQIAFNCNLQQPTR